MKTIFRIAKAELLSLFYSPVAWLVLLFYFIACGLGFTEIMVKFINVQKVFLEADASWQGFDVNGLTHDLTADIMFKLASNLYLFIPLLTMGVINREVNSGSIKLLYSSPIRIRDIVLGKYLGLLVLAILLMVIVSIFLVTTSFIIKNPDSDRHFASLLGVFLIANAYIAIGLFISCVTNYQIVAGVLTFVVFFILSSISGLWQQFDFFRDLTYFLSISQRAGYLLNGLISTSDVFYFILITTLFLGFALIKLKSTQESKPWTISFTRYSLLFVIILFLGYISARPGQVKYWDLTREKTNTIHPNTQAVLKELDGSPLTVTLYTNLLGINAAHGLPQNRNFYLWKYWEQYRRFYPDMQFRYVYYYDVKPGDSAIYRMHPKKNMDQIAQKVAKELGIRKSIFMKPEEIRKKVNFEEEPLMLIMQLEYKGKKTWLRTYNDNTVWPTQENVSGSIRRLVRDSIPTLLFITGHFERSPYRQGQRDYGGNILATGDRSSLINLGVNADTISLKTTDIPAGTSCLVVADPRARMDTIEQNKIKDYLKNGGNAIILAEVKKQPMLNPILHSIGVNVDNGTIVNIDEHEAPDLLDATLTDTAAYMADENTLVLYRNKVIKRIRAVADGGAHISYKETDGFKIEPIVEFKGSEKRWIENGTFVSDSAAPVFSAAEGDVQNDKYLLGIKMTRTINNKEQRIIVTGDADIITRYRNVDIGHSFYGWSLNNEYPVYTYKSLPTDVFFTASASTGKTLRWIYIYLIPGLLLASAIILLVRRKRK